MELRKIIIGVLLATLVLSASCSGEKRELKNLVEVYAGVLVETYLGPRPELIQNFTAKRQQIKIDSYISYLLKRNRILKCELKSLEFGKVEISGENAEVHTTEQWTYKYLDSRTRKPVSEELYMKYANTYKMVRQDGRWVIDEIEARELEGDELKQKDEMKDMHKKLYEKLDLQKQKDETR